MIDTKRKILDTAERLFAEQGFGATSLRHIIAEAGVNLAAIHYHFGTKEELLDHLLKRKLGVVNQIRLEMLDRAEAACGGAPVPVEQVLDALLLPALRSVRRNSEFSRLMGRLHAEGLMRNLVRKHFTEVWARFYAVFRRSLPHLSAEELHWRLHFLSAAMAHTLLAHPSGLPPGAELGLEQPLGEWDAEQVSRCLVEFLRGGLLAPATHVVKTEEE